MKNVKKISLVVILIAALGGLLYWQFVKKRIVKDSIEKTVSKKTDSLYYIHYDSSRIDEINGNALFYNVVLQSDSAQQVLLNSTDSLPNALYNIKIKQVSANGVDIVGLLQKQNMAARKIVLLKPVIQIINTGSDKPKSFTMNDTLQLYEKMLGKFKSIRAGVIQVDSGTVLFTNRKGEVQTRLDNINITLNNFLVDSTKDYQNIVSYFIKDVKVTVMNVVLPPSKNGSRLTIEKIDYDAVKKYLHIDAIRQYQSNNTSPVTELKKIQVNELNTDAFIVQQQLKAGQVSCAGGTVTVYTNKKEGKSKKGDQSLELSTDMIDQAQIGGISLGDTKVIIINRGKPGSAPFTLNKLNLKVTKMLNINEGTSINNIINNAEWELSADGFSWLTKSKLYTMTVGRFSVNNAASLIKMSNFHLKPALSEKDFNKAVHFQHDTYDLNFNDIVLSGVNVKKLISDQRLEMENASLQPIVNIFHDRNLPGDGKSKIGNYPQQQVLKLPFPLYIHTLKIDHADVSYKERSVKSKMTGNIFFKDVNATLSNVTNFPERIKTNPLFTLKATGKFLGKSNLSTEWLFPLNASNGAFTIKGSLDSMDATGLNSMIEPLTMALIKSGQIDEVNFTMDGTDAGAKGEILFMYRDLKMEMLKKGDDATLKKKGLMSAITNILIKNNNTNRSKTDKMNYDRDSTKSFFNLVWKTIFAGVKKTAM